MTDLDLTNEERALLLSAQVDDGGKSGWLLSLVLGVALAATLILGGQGFLSWMRGGGWEGLERFGGALAAVCFVGLVREMTRFQKQAYSLIRKLAAPAGQDE